MVQQDAFLFTTTIENNIAYGDPWAQRAAHRARRRIRAAAQLHRSACPPGYHTVVGERGVSLSGGQRQRLSIARSLMLRPAVLVFDDSTAAIDAGTEQRIRAAMRSYASDRVTIIIAHRLSSLMHADQILFLEDGRIVERGTHEELLALGGRYRALYDLQVRPTTDDRGMGAASMIRRAATDDDEGRPQRPRRAGGRRLAPRSRRRSSARPSTRRSSGASGASCSPYRTQDAASRSSRCWSSPLTQLAIPLIIRYAIDNGMVAGRPDRAVLAWAVARLRAW